MAVMDLKHTTRDSAVYEGRNTYHIVQRMPDGSTSTTSFERADTLEDAIIMANAWQEWVDDSAAGRARA